MEKRESGNGGLPYVEGERMTIAAAREIPSVDRKLHQGHFSFVSKDGPREPLPVLPCDCIGSAESKEVGEPVFWKTVPIGVGPSKTEVIYLCTNPSCEAGLKTRRIEWLQREGYLPEE